MKVFGYNLLRLFEYTRDIILKTNEIRASNNKECYHQQKLQLDFVMGKKINLDYFNKWFQSLNMFDIYFLDNLCSVVTQVVENAKAADEVSFFLLATIII